MIKIHYLMLYSLLKFYYKKSSQKSTLFDDPITQSPKQLPWPTRPGDVDLLLEELRMASEIVEQHRLATVESSGHAATNGMWVEWTIYHYPLVN